MECGGPQIDDFSGAPPLHPKAVGRLMIKAAPQQALRLERQRAARLSARVMAGPFLSP